MKVLEQTKETEAKVAKHIWHFVNNYKLLKCQWKWPASQPARHCRRNREVGKSIRLAIRRLPHKAHLVRHLCHFLTLIKLPLLTLLLVSILFVSKLLQPFWQVNVCPLSVVRCRFVYCSVYFRNKIQLGKPSFQSKRVCCC